MTNREPHRRHGLLQRSVAARDIRASTAIEGHHVSPDHASAAVDLRAGNPGLSTT